MNVLYINDNDLIGRRFNGYDLQQMLNEKKGFESKQLVACKTSKDSNVLSFVDNKSSKMIREKCKEFEEKISMQSVIYPFGETISRMEIFKEADIVHYHLLFNHFMSIFSFKKLSKLKPTVWSLHDPWAITGHCVHPIDCKGWLVGCEDCPYLGRYSPLQEDNASSIWKIKKEVYNSIDIDIIVYSQWMYDLVKESPLMSNFKRIHLIPFGLDLNLFKRKKNRNEIRDRLKINKDNFVLMFRQDSQEWKGLKYIKEMLKNLKTKKPITLLTVGDTGMLEEFKENYQVIEYEWVNNNNLLIDLYSSADLFLMPSIAEAFGLMAIEAMSCSLPILVFDGTALPSVIFAPDCGIAIKPGDTESFVSVVERLSSHPEECRNRGDLGRKLAEKYYSIERYNKQLIDLYESIYSRKKGKKK